MEPDESPKVHKFEDNWDEPVRAPRKPVEKAEEGLIDDEPEDFPSPADKKAVAKSSRKRLKSALALKMAGASFDEIAEALDYDTPAAAKEAYLTALASTLPEADDFQRQRDLQRARFEKLVSAHWTQALDRNNPDQVFHSKRVSDLLGQLGKLDGLDAPMRVQHAPDIAEFERIAQKITETIRDNEGLAEEGDPFG
jgi:hypothetical protein